MARSRCSRSRSSRSRVASSCWGCRSCAERCRCSRRSIWGSPRSTSAPTSWATTFLFIVVLVSIVVFTFIGKPRGLGDHLLRIACMPLIAGVAFEFIRLTGKYQHIGWVRALSWPSMQFQLLTTREPDLAMCETAIAALELVRNDETVKALEAAGGEGRPEISFVQ